MRSFNQKEIEDFLNQSPSKAYKLVPHQFNSSHAGKACCTKCGLLALRNRATDWCVEKGCEFENHPDYTNAMKRLTK